MDITQETVKLEKTVDKNTNLPVVSRPVFYRRRFLFELCLVISTIAIGVLTYIAKTVPYLSVDLSITLSLQSINNQVFDFLMHAVSYMGNDYPSTIMAGSLIGILFLKSRKKESAMLFFSTAGAGIIGLILKAYTNRIRPDPTLVEQAFEFTRRDSFPSGHVLYYVGLFGFLLFLTYSLLQKGWLRTLLLVTLSLLITSAGLSRIYLGAHWFSDVLGAYLTGFIWLVITIYIYNHWQQRSKT